MPEKITKIKDKACLLYTSDILNNIGIVMRSTQGLKQRQADSCPGARFALKYGYDEYHDKVDDAENA